MAGEYTYIFCDLITGKIIDDLPLVSASFNTKLNGVGDFSGQFMLRDDRLRGREPLRTCTPGRTSVFVDRNGVLVWGGIIWSRNYWSETGRVQIDGQSFESYLYKRILRTSLRYITATDQVTIAENLISQALDGQAPPIKVVTDRHQGVAPVTRRADYPDYGYHIIGEAVEDLSQLQDSFDWSVRVAYDSLGAPTATLYIGYPFLGRTLEQSQLYFDMPGNIKSYEWPENASESATWVVALGAGQEGSRVRATAQDDSLHADGWPKLDVRQSFQDVTRTSTLQAHANAAIQTLNPNKVPLPRITVRSNEGPSIGSYFVGDHAYFTITGDRFAGLADDTLTAAYRITQMNITTPSSSTSEQVYFYLSEPELSLLRRPPDLASDFIALNRRVDRPLNIPVVE